MDSMAELFDTLLKKKIETASVFIVGKDDLASVTARHHMI